ncbi:MAG: peptidylprolyl isomerase [Candidatus Omnitrophica bacterium]|nr:peptidylprolyl isomerase [Candidatus Omnitrophota bacterium]MDD5310769.1 peptidylprolyl isomerase [Candidatus Omnitrophota bacterium]MDD5545548.1 peptidylprolyl isomerase [Candidatus Omnitrophota bacterium]
MRTGISMLLLVLALGLHPQALCQTTGAVNKILAVVNDEVVTETDLDAALGSSIEELKKEFSGDELKAKTEEVRKELLKQMIEDRLILQEAKKYKINVDDFEVEQRLKDVKSRFPSEDAFYSEVERSGVSTDILKKRYKENIMMSKLVNQQVREKIVVTPTEIESYYKKHSAELKAPESVHLFGIVIRFDAGSTEDDIKQKAEDVVKLAREGRDFNELAKVYSQGAKAQEGGDFGIVERGQMRGDFENVIFVLKPGEISDPVKTDAGYFIFKVYEKKESYVRPLQEARSDIEDIIYRDKAQKRYQDWIEKLKRDAFIQVK